MQIRAYLYIGPLGSLVAHTAITQGGSAEHPAVVFFY